MHEKIVKISVINSNNLCCETLLVPQQQSRWGIAEEKIKLLNGFFFYINAAKLKHQLYV